MLINVNSLTSTTWSIFVVGYLFFLTKLISSIMGIFLLHWQGSIVERFRFISLNSCHDCIVSSFIVSLWYLFAYSIYIFFKELVCFPPKWDVCLCNNPPSVLFTEILTGVRTGQSLPPVPEEDYYTSEVEAAGLPPSTSSSSFTSSTSSQQLDFLQHPDIHQQAKLTNDPQNLSTSSSPHHHRHLSGDGVTAVSTSFSTDTSVLCSSPYQQQTFSPTLDSSPSPLKHALPTHSDSSAFSNYSPCLSFPNPTPPLPTTHNHAEAGNSLQHPPSICTPRIFPPAPTPSVTSQHLQQSYNSHQEIPHGASLQPDSSIYSSSSPLTLLHQPPLAHLSSSDSTNRHINSYETERKLQHPHHGSKPHQTSPSQPQHILPHPSSKPTHRLTVKSFSQHDLAAPSTPPSQILLPISSTQPSTSSSNERITDFVVPKVGIFPF